MLKVSVADDSRTAETEITHQPYIFREGGTRYLILCPPRTLWEENHDLISDHQWKVFFHGLGDSGVRVLSFIGESCDLTKLAMEFYL